MRNFAEDRMIGRLDRTTERNTGFNGEARRFLVAYRASGNNPEERRRLALEEAHKLFRPVTTEPDVNGLYCPIEPATN